MPERRKREGPEPRGAPGWMVTYGDMMGLLLCFFVLLAAFSAINEQEVSRALASIRSALAFFPQEPQMTQPNLVAPSSQQVSGGIERVARELRRRLQIEGMADAVKVEYDKEGGLKIIFPSQILFDTARAELRPVAYPVLKELAGLLSGVGEVFVEVRGHTDSRPLIITTRYRDNYDLSFARADTVARYLTSAGSVPLERFEIVACGPGQPIAGNDTEEGQQANRRVEIYVRPTAKSPAVQELHEKVRTLWPSEADGTSVNPGRQG